jgi:hypothetical protein
VGRKASVANEIRTGSIRTRARTDRHALVHQLDDAPVQQSFSIV